MIPKRMALVLLACVAAFALSAAANPLPVISCGWEDPDASVLGLFGDGDPPIIATNVTTPDPVFAGDRALRLVDNAASGTPQAYIAFIWGLVDGQQVTAGFWRYDDTPDGAPSCRIWGHWNDELPDNPDGYSGSAGGNDDYGTGTGWEWTEWTWTVVDGHTGLVIEVRTYSSAGDTVWIDGLEIIAPETSTVQTPCEIVVGTESSTLSDVKALFK
jgi:hypothetical protein